jgi:hypothetical protein
LLRCAPAPSKTRTISSSGHRSRNFSKSTSKQSPSRCSRASGRSSPRWPVQPLRTAMSTPVDLLRATAGGIRQGTSGAGATLRARSALRPSQKSGSWSPAVASRTGATGALPFGKLFGRFFDQVGIVEIHGRAALRR